MTGRLHVRRLSVDAACNALAVAIFLVLAAVLCVIVHWRYAIFRNDVDLGIFTQVIAGIGHGFASTAEGRANHLLVHWSPILVAAWPFLRAFGPAGLEYFQAIAVAATILPIWALARTKVSAPLALGMTAVAAVYPTLWANGVGDFHEMAFVPVLSATFVYALDRRRWKVAVVAALLLACTKEDQFVALAVNGLLFVATSGRDGTAKRIGWTVFAIAVVMAVAYFGMIRPLLDRHVSYLSLRFFDWSGSQIQSNDWFASVLLPRARYLLLVLAPLAFLPCISRFGLFLIPGFVEIFAAHQPVTIAPGAHYSALLTGYALAAFVEGASRVNRARPRLSRILVAGAGAVAVYVGIFASPMEYWYYLYRFPNRHDALLEAALRRLPPRGDVGAEDEIFAHLGLNPNASIDFNGQKWFVYDQTAYSQHWHEVDGPAVRSAVARHRYVVTSARDGIVVLQRSGG